jgi:hypothetical protein
MSASATSPEPNGQSRTDQEEARYRRNMRYLTDELWRLRVHELGMALLHDLADDAKTRHARCHERLPEP